ncbi:MAG: TetR/AcrR family transcriptional regulator [Acidimicrobiales bacterium]|nr:TetR/AcrR family transcriptional regulator [Acidimicrobiales bacterium]
MTGRVDDIVAAARTVVESHGADALTMQAVADQLHIKAPSLYKHVAGKRAIEVELIARTLSEMGEALHAAIAAEGGGGRGAATAALLAAYRRQALAHPHLYRLATAGPLPRDALPEGLEDWAGEPFFLVTGDPYRAQALWSFAHGMVILELDRRFPDHSALDRTWAEGAAAFA